MQVTKQSAAIIRQTWLGTCLLCCNNVGNDRFKKELGIIQDKQGILINTVLLSNLASLKALARTLLKIIDIFKIKAIILLPKQLNTFIGLNFSPQSNSFHFYSYNLGNLLLLTEVCAYLRQIFVTVYNSLCVYQQVRMDFSQKVYIFVGIISRIIGGFKENFRKE